MSSDDRSTCNDCAHIKCQRRVKDGEACWDFLGMLTNNDIVAIGRTYGKRSGVERILKYFETIGRGPCWGKRE